MNQLKKARAAQLMKELIILIRNPKLFEKWLEKQRRKIKTH